MRVTGASPWSHSQKDGVISKHLAAKTLPKGFRGKAEQPEAAVFTLDKKLLATANQRTPAGIL